MRCLFFLFFGLFSIHISGQQVMVEIGRVSSTFDYTNSHGEKLENAFSDNGLSAAIGYRMPLSDWIYGFGALSYDQYGTYGSQTDIDIAYAYNLDYLGFSLGAEGEFFKKSGFTGYVRLAVEPQFFLKGSQEVNNEVLDLKGVEEFDSPFIFTTGGLGVNYCADRFLAITLRYDYGLGFSTGGSSSPETLRFRTSTINLGLLINLKFCKYCLKSRSQ